MYTPGTIDDLIFRNEMAVYGPRDHQRIIAKLTTRLCALYYDAKTIRLEPLPETMLDEGQVVMTETSFSDVLNLDLNDMLL